MIQIALLPGGASHGCNPAGALCTLKKNYDVYIGSSAGALNGVLLALEKYDEIEYEQTHTTNRELYGIFPPINSEGEFDLKKFIAAMSVAMIRKRTYVYKFGEQLEKKIRKHFDRDDFIDLYNHGPEVIVTNHDYDSTVRPSRYVSNRDPFMTHDKFVRAIVASASIPVFAIPQKIDSTNSVDGGVLDNIPSSILENYPDSRVDVWLTHSLRKEEDVRREVNSIPRGVMNLVSASRYHLMYNDLVQIENPNTTLYYADHMDWNSANFDPEKMRNSFNQARTRVQAGRLNAMHLNKWRLAKNLRTI